MKKPREKRTQKKLPVRVWGMDSTGKLFSIEAFTVDITPRGARLEGVSCMLQRGAIVGVECGRSRARFRVAWVGHPGTSREGQLGIQCVEPGKYIWGVPLQRMMDDEVLPSPEPTHDRAARLAVPRF
jgi:hypothetical protein